MDVFRNYRINNWGNVMLIETKFTSEGQACLYGPPRPTEVVGGKGRGVGLGPNLQGHPRAKELHHKKINSLMKILMCSILGSSCEYLHPRTAS